MLVVAPSKGGRSMLFYPNRAWSTTRVKYANSETVSEPIANPTKLFSISFAPSLRQNAFAPISLGATTNAVYYISCFNQNRGEPTPTPA